MAEIETIEELRSSLAAKRMHADERLQYMRSQPAMPTVDEVMESRPVRFMIEHPVLTGLAAGALYLFGPARLLRIATAGIGIAQSVRTVRAAQELLTGGRHEDPVA